MNDEQPGLDVPISAVGQIPRNQVSVFTPDRIEKFVELPVLEACRRLYKLGFRTLDSTGNKSNIGGEAEISIQMSSLCTVNDQRLRRLAERDPQHVRMGVWEGWGDVASLRVAIPDANISARQISDELCRIIDSANLISQPAYWIIKGRRETFIANPGFADGLEEIIKRRSEDPSDIDPIEVVLELIIDETNESGEVIGEKPLKLTQADINFLNAYMNVCYDTTDGVFYENSALRDFYRESCECAAPGSSARVTGAALHR